MYSLPLHNVGRHDYVYVLVYTVHLLHARAADSAYLVKRLAKTRVLEGHSGCVSRDVSVCSGCVHVHVYTYTYIVHIHVCVCVPTCIMWIISFPTDSCVLVSCPHSR